MGPKQRASRADRDRITVAGAPGTGRGRVLVLNATYEPINVCTVRRATVLVLKSKAEIVEHGEDPPALRADGAGAPGRDPADHLRSGPA